MMERFGLLQMEYVKMMQIRKLMEAKSGDIYRNFQYFIFQLQINVEYCHQLEIKSGLQKIL